MRLISFSLTEKQFRARTKTVTRRLGWRFLKPGDRLMGVRKAMGLKKGEKVKRLHAIEVVSVRREPLYKIRRRDCMLEGFAHLSTFAFVAMFCAHNHCSSTIQVTRIEFRHL